MTKQNKTEKWQDRLETTFYDSNPDAADGEWYPLYQDVENIVGELLSDARREERERCLEALPKVIDIDDQTNYRESTYEDGVDDGFNNAIDQATKALLSLPDQEELEIKKENGK